MTEHRTPEEVFRALAHGKHQQPETLILRQVSDYLRAAGWYVIRMQQGLGAHKGLSDLVAMKDGRTIWIEVKTPRGRLSDWQEAFGLNVQRAGGEYVVARGLDDVTGL